MGDCPEILNYVHITYLLVLRTQRDAREQIDAIRQTAREQVEAAQRAAKEQIDVTKSMAETHIETLREDLKTRLLLHYESLWDSNEMKARRRSLSNSGLTLTGRRSVYPFAGDEVPNFFESLGVLLRKGHLDTEMVWSVFGYYAMRYWQGLGDYYVRDRQATGDNELWSGFEYLTNELREYEAKRRNLTLISHKMNLKDSLRKRRL